MDAANGIRFTVTAITYLLLHFTGIPLHRALIAIAVTGICRGISFLTEAKYLPTNQYTRFLQFVGNNRRFELCWWLCLVLFSWSPVAIGVIIFVTGWLGFVLAFNMQAIGMLDYIENI